VTANNKRRNFEILFFCGTLFALFFIYVVITLNAPHCKKTRVAIVFADRLATIGPLAR